MFSKKALAAFVQNPEALLQKKVGYAPQSGEIFSILEQMKDGFKTNLADTQKEEM